MTVAHSTGALLGTSESSGVSISQGANSAGSETDLLGDDASEGWMHVYLVYTTGTTTPTGGTIDVTLFYSRVSGQSYTTNPVLIYSAPPSPLTASNTQKVYLGQFPVDRRMTGQVANNVTPTGAGSALSNVFLGYSLFKES